MNAFPHRWLVLCLVLTLTQCQPDQPLNPVINQPTRDDHLAMGNPDGARPSEASPTAYLINQPTYSLSYN